MNPKQLRSDLLTYYGSKQGRTELVSVAIGIFGVMVRSRSAVIFSLATFRLFVYPLRVVAVWRATGKAEERVDGAAIGALEDELRHLRQRLDDLAAHLRDDQLKVQNELQIGRSASSLSISALIERLDAIDARASNLPPSSSH